MIYFFELLEAKYGSQRYYHSTVVIVVRLNAFHTNEIIIIITLTCRSR